MSDYDRIGAATIGPLDTQSLSVKSEEFWQAELDTKRRGNTLDLFDEFTEAGADLVQHLAQASVDEAITDVHRIGFLMTNQPSASAQAIFDALTAVKPPSLGDEVAHRLDQFASSGTGAFAYVGAHALGHDEHTARQALDLGSGLSNLLPAVAAMAGRRKASPPALSRPSPAFVDPATIWNREGRFARSAGGGIDVLQMNLPTGTCLRQAAMANETDRNHPPDNGMVLSKPSQVPHQPPKEGLIAKAMARLFGPGTAETPASQQLMAASEPTQVLSAAHASYRSRMSETDRYVKSLAAKARDAIFLGERFGNRYSFPTMMNLAVQTHQQPKFQLPPVDGTSDGHYLTADPNGHIYLYRVHTLIAEGVVGWRSIADIRPEAFGTGPTTVAERLEAQKLYLQSITLDAQQRAALPSTTLLSIDDTLGKAKRAQDSWAYRFKAWKQRKAELAKATESFRKETHPLFQEIRQCERRISELDKELKAMAIQISLLENSPDRAGDLKLRRGEQASASKRLSDLQAEKLEKTQRLDKEAPAAEKELSQLESTMHNARVSLVETLSGLIDSLHQQLNAPEPPPEASNDAASTAAGPVGRLQRMIGHACEAMATSPPNELHAALNQLNEDAKVAIAKKDAAASRVDAVMAQLEEIQSIRDATADAHTLSLSRLQDAAMALYEELSGERFLGITFKPTKEDEEELREEIREIDSQIDVLNNAHAKQQALNDTQIESRTRELVKAEQALARAQEDALSRVKQLIQEFRSQNAHLLPASLPEPVHSLMAAEF